MTSPISWAAETHMGLVRQTNQDYHLARPDLGLWVVCDGMGGHAKGGEAAKICAKTVVRAFARRPSLTDAIREAHKAVAAIIHADQGPAPGTTIVAMHVDGTKWHLAWAGDSRAWLVDGKKCRQLTTDHTQAQRLVDWEEITPEEAVTHPLRGKLTNAVMGGVELVVSRTDGTLVPGQCIVMATDGLAIKNDPREMGRIVYTASTPTDAVHKMIEITLAQGAPDNVTAVQIGDPRSGGGLWNRLKTGLGL